MELIESNLNKVIEKNIKKIIRQIAKAKYDKVLRKWKKELYKPRRIYDKMKSVELDWELQKTYKSYLLAKRNERNL